LAAEPHNTPDPDAVAIPAPPRTRRALKIAGAVIGLALFAAALATVFANPDDLRAAARTVADAPPWLIAAAVALPVFNWLAVTGAFVVLTPRYVPEHGRPVRTGEMAALIGSAWLLNYLPMRPGLVGRVAYHKKVNGIRVKDSARMLIESGALTGVAVVTLLALALLMLNVHGTTALVVSSAAPLAVAALAWAVLALARSPLWRYAACLFFKLVDMAIWVARYAVVFALVGAPLEAARTVLIAGISQFVLLVPFTGNGLGIREWAVELTADAGLEADLLNRAAETLAVLPVGLVATWWVARSLARHAADCAESREPDQHHADTRTVDTTDGGERP